jgi:NADPH:quinone reductase-like Zn-dependent oxidoreductase
MTSSKRVIMQTASPTIADLAYLRGLIEEEKIRTVIDRTYPLEQIVEAHRYVEMGGKLGNVVVTVGHENRA